MNWNPVLGRRGPGDVDQVLFDLWSIVHFVSGIMLWKLGFDANVAFMILIAFELVENYFGGVIFFNWFGAKMGRWGKVFSSQENYKGDSIGNMLTDIMFGILGFVLCYYNFLPIGGQLF